MVIKFFSYSEPLVNLSMANENEYKADFPSEIIREGKVQVLVPRLSAYGVYPAIMRHRRLRCSIIQLWNLTRPNGPCLQDLQHIVDREISICEP